MLIEKSRSESPPRRKSLVRGFGLVQERERHDLERSHYKLFTYLKISVEGVTTGIHGFAEGKRRRLARANEPLLFVIETKQPLNPGQPEMRQA
jgi:hypothetical protein